ncbi:hypothetical protein [Aquisalimonas sp.]|nr:hypothetical protein [Aquisalimonas sp.]
MAGDLGLGLPRHREPIADLDTGRTENTLALYGGEPQRDGAPDFAGQ